MRSDLPLGQIYRGIVLFLIADIRRLGLLVSVPALTLWLRRQLDWLQRHHRISPYRPCRLYRLCKTGFSGLNRCQ